MANSEKKQVQEDTKTGETEELSEDIESEEDDFPIFSNHLPNTSPEPEVLQTNPTEPDPHEVHQDEIIQVDPTVDEPKTSPSKPSKPELISEPIKFEPLESRIISESLGTEPLAPVIPSSENQALAIVPHQPPNDSNSSSTWIEEDSEGEDVGQERPAYRTLPPFIKR
nr:hypothetical protein Iba_chr01cCG2350 [Ipomoea batatas]